MHRFYIVTQYIDYYLYEKDLSKEEFCQRCGIEIKSLNELYQNQKISLKDLLKISNVLDLSLTVLVLDLAGGKKLENIISFYFKSHEEDFDRLEQ